MFLTSKRWYARTEQRARGPFLALFSKDPGGEIRCAVRSVTLHQSGHFMVGSMEISSKLAKKENDQGPSSVSGHYAQYYVPKVQDGLYRIYVEGTYGNNGLTIDVEPYVGLWEILHPLPVDLTWKLWKDKSGWNSAGDEGPLIWQWATENIKILRRPFMTKMSEASRREEANEINTNTKTREELEARHGKKNVWDTTEMTAAFTVQGFAAPYVAVVRKSDGKEMALAFQHHPRFYFDPTATADASETSSTTTVDEQPSGLGILGEKLVKAGFERLQPAGVLRPELPDNLKAVAASSTPIVDRGIEDTSKRDPAVHLMGASRAGGSKYIEDMEAGGVRQLKESQQIPRKLMGFDEDLLIEAGFELLPPGDDALFRPARLPEGWEKRLSPDHGMYVGIYDARGFVRFSLFYKAAYYDRRADMKVEKRFAIRRDWDAEDKTKGTIKFDITAQMPNSSERKLLHSETYEDLIPRLENASPEEYRANYDKQDAAEQKVQERCLAWLEERYPDALNPLKHWDVDL